MSLPALLPALAVEQVAVAALPRIRLGSDLLVRKTVSLVLVLVSYDVVNGEQAGQAHHHCNIKNNLLWNIINVCIGRPMK